MPAPLEEMPPLYLNMIEEVTKSAAEEFLLAAAEELHEDADHTLSAVTDRIDISVSFDQRRRQGESREARTINKVS